MPVELVSSDTLHTLLLYVAIMGILLVVGVIIRLKFKIFKRYFIPASLIAGFLGLALGPYGVKLFSEEMVSTWGNLSGLFITIVFAPMLIGLTFQREDRKESAVIAARHTIYSYVGSLLQWSIPVILTVLVLVPLFKVNDLFGSIVEIGWAGGHGTAAGMMEVYNNLGWEDGGSLAVTSATIGIVFGIVTGIILINYGVRKGKTTILQDPSEIQEDSNPDVIPYEKREASSVGTFNPDIVEGFAFHAGILGGAIAIGWVLQQFVDQFIHGIPLFPMAMLGGLIINMLIVNTKFFKMIDMATFGRMQGIALDFLIVGAVASVKVSTVIEYAWPLLILMSVSLLMMIWYFLYLGPRFFDEDWFEQAIVHFGSYTGVAAVGLMLMRTADPDMETNAARGYALRSPFYVPVLGGGLLTIALPMLMIQYGALVVGLSCLAVVVALIVLARILGLYKKHEHV